MTVDLRAYTTRAKELEAAIYTQKELMRKHEMLLKEQRPVPPRKESAVAPPRPVPPPPPPSFKNSTTAAGAFAGVMGVITCILVVNISESFMPGVVVLLLFGLFAAYLINEGAKKNTKYQKEVKEFDHALSSWQAHMRAYEEQQRRLDAKYSDKVAHYQTALTTHDANYSLVMRQHKDALVALEEALQAVYDENVIFPKYRNLVAITTINEYLMSGRCSELEGPNGAYNLYEMELRQNIVIAQLSSIVDNLEQIRNSQFTLYAELQESNRTIRAILDEAREINASAKLTTYFTGVTALAAISPTYYTGVIV